MAKFAVAVSWEVCGVMDIEAESLDEAIRIAKEDQDLPLPDGDYIDGSFLVDSQMSEEMNY